MKREIKIANTLLSIAMFMFAISCHIKNSPNSKPKTTLHYDEDSVLVVKRIVKENRSIEYVFFDKKGKPRNDVFVIADTNRVPVIGHRIFKDSLNKLLVKKAKKPTGLADVHANCLIRVYGVINTDSTLSNLHTYPDDVYVCAPLAKTALEQVRKFKWVPAQMQGRKVASYRLVYVFEHDF